MRKGRLIISAVCVFSSVIFAGCHSQSTPTPVNTAAETRVPQAVPENHADSSDCKSDAYDPKSFFPLNKNDYSGQVVDNCTLDEKLQPVAESKKCWYEIGARLYDGGAECLPNWLSRLDPDRLYDGPVDIPVPELCRHHCIPALPGMVFADGKALCRIPSEQLGLPAAPRGYRCLSADLVDSHKLTLKTLQHDYSHALGKPYESNDEDEEIEEIEEIEDYKNYPSEVISKITPFVAGFVCSDRYKTACLCGGKEVPAGTVCNAKQVVQVCENAEGCTCGDVKLSAGMYCDRGKAWCGTTPISAQTKGFSCIHGELYCTADSCTRDGQTLSKGTALLSEKPLILACLEEKGCKAYHQSFANQSFILNDTIYNNTEFVQPDSLVCGDAHIDENASGFACTGNALVCRNESCTIGKHTVSQGTAVLSNKLDLFHASNPKGTSFVIDGVSYPPLVSVRLTKDKTEILCSTESSEPTDKTQLSPGTDYVCSEQGWICNQDQCQYHGITIHRGTALYKTIKPVKDYYTSDISKDAAVLKCLAETCLCGTETIAEGSWCVEGTPYCKSLNGKLWTAPGKGMACVEDCDTTKHHVGEPCKDPSDEIIPGQLYCDWDSKTLQCRHFAWVCQEESCEAYGKTFAKGDVIPQVMSNGMLCTAHECTCGSSKLAQNRSDMICENEKLIFQCGTLPRMDVTDPAAFPFQCYNHIAPNVLKCVADSCTYGVIQYKRDEICSDKHCIREFPIPESALFRVSESDCAMGQCGSFELNQDEWMSELLRADGEVCVDGNCPCGKNVCGKLSYCKEGQCYCGSTEEPENRGEWEIDKDQICISMKYKFYNHYGLEEVYDEGVKGEWYEVDK